MFHRHWHTSRGSFSVELGGGLTGIGLKLDHCESRIVFQLGVGVMLFVGVPWPRALRPSDARWARWAPATFDKAWGSPARETALNYFDRTFWLDLWSDTHSWGPADRKVWPWQGSGWKFNWAPLDTLLGRMAYTSIPTVPVEHPLVMPASADYPETIYTARVHWTAVTHARSRFPFLSSTYHTTTVEVADGVPHPGKGTTGYNCGEGRTYSISVPGTLGPYKAVQTFIDKLVETRQRYPL